MYVKTHPPVTVLYSQHQTTLPQLSQYIGTVVKDLCAEAVHHNALISGAPLWIYHGMDGKPDTVFTLTIAIPIQGQFQPSRFAIKQLPAFRAVTHTHEGAWDTLAETYQEVMHHIDAHKIPMTEECREVYLNIDFQQQQYNVTQVQMGVI
ncbi:AraC family transcriptional regulator [Paraflavitalea soli]|uniref:AraC family transcriptional regulator n=1 Tax=Paraflavitalea soli TaxID=2315862 RepID=A0A3B7MVJ8_9BACT|nr:GyrI-like domain-containing protein [Paraflavitalea soli]AXY77046.1 AraC family transcriptional regulator [Paraflavitalea soli]